MTAVAFGSLLLFARGGSEIEEISHHLLSQQLGERNETVEAPFHPFPQHVKYQGRIIKPDNMTQDKVDDEVKKAYDSWKDNYLIQHPKKADEYYMRYTYGEGASTVSEAHGYGMLILACLHGRIRSRGTGKIR